MILAIRMLWLTALLLASVCHAENAVSSLPALRKVFLQTEQYIYQDRDAEYFTLAETLKDYPLYPYLHYQWLKKHLDDTQAVQDFLNTYESSRYSRLLRPKWLLQLAKTQQWPLFSKQYRNNDDPDLHCYYAQAQWQSGQQQAALESARQLWLSGKSQPASCDAVFAWLKTSSIFTPNLVWQRFQAALNQDNLPLATALQTGLPEAEQPDAQLWLKLHQQPSLLAEASEWKHSYPLAPALFVHTLLRWLDSDPGAALQVWETEKQNFAIAADTLSDTDKRLGVALALKRDSRAYDKLAQIANKDASTREWVVRAALNQQNWQQVYQALNDLHAEEKIQDKWQYWQARTLTSLGQTELGLSIYQQIAKNRSFYGYLAADHLLQQPLLIDHPLQVSSQELDKLEQKTEFQVSSELLAINRKQEAKHQWWYAIANLEQHDLMVAAKLAQRWQCPALAIFTIAKANEWNDIELRFPLQFNSQIQLIANDQQLDPALIFGLIRQESAFDEYADSPAGAKGLMQIMPKTAQQIAQNFNENWTGETSLFNPLLNIKYGSFYFKKLLQQFNGNHVLATAAYNAGPNRVKRWLPETKSLPGDIWIETIPYKETRSYVSSVLLYALIYQQRLQKNSLKLENLISIINPG
ncbi:transglycosylase SLT domain-containing protein [Methylomonas sp. AM2-LC]|uniref:transglycosylase SLT domain-containing protein n=1 Tax=Methylomonas sp. AM2-LC TaxID=3153301 RepID=UPI0032637E7F